MLNFLIKKLSLKAKSSKLKTNQGFTLIETLVIIVITVFLTTIMIGFSHNGERQIALFRDQSQVASILNRAKSLSINLFSEDEADKPCAYGVHFNNNEQTFLIFKDLKTSCNGIYDEDSSGELFEKYQIDPQFKFDTTLTDVVFIPPDPTVKITSGSPGSPDEATIKIKLDDKNFKTVKITKYGQITMQ